MKGLITSFAAGIVFAIGLGISGMTQADKVIGFLNVAGDWDASLGLVMGAAVATHFVLFRLILRRASPVFGERFQLPTRTDIDGRLIGGSALFGIGWALGGYCPGPALVSASTGAGPVLTFVAAMTGGMLVFHAIDTAWAGRAVHKPSARST